MESLLTAGLRNGARAMDFGELLRSAGERTGRTPGGGSGGGGGAAAAAGVLTAVDEDGEGDEEAAAPTEFEYFTDAEDEA